jgi:hypothetical protein
MRKSVAAPIDRVAVRPPAGRAEWLALSCQAACGASLALLLLDTDVPLGLRPVRIALAPERRIRWRSRPTRRSRMLMRSVSWKKPSSAFWGREIEPTPTGLFLRHPQGASEAKPAEGTGTT